MERAKCINEKQLTDCSKLANAVRQMQLTDSGKLLFVFEGANSAAIVLDETEIDAMVFLLNARGAVAFGYPFLLNPLPVSTELRQDMHNLVETGYLVGGSPVHITKEGSEWISKLLQRVGNSHEVIDELEANLRELITEYRRQAFQLVYAAITG